VEPEDEVLLTRLAIDGLVPSLDKQPERLNGLAAAGYVILTDQKLVYRLTVRGRVYVEGRKAGSPKE
jgi:hypothetical protein